jgi:hypothetical protein
VQAALTLLRVPASQDFSSVAEKTGTYTAMDYADIMEHLVKRWRVAERSDLTGEVRQHPALWTYVILAVLCRYLVCKHSNAIAVQVYGGVVACSDVAVRSDLTGRGEREQATEAAAGAAAAVPATRVIVVWPAQRLAVTAVSWALR